jgi:diadenylate cyclase
MWPALQTFRLRDAIDIVVVAIVLYRVFVMFKETRAVQMLLGLAGLMVAVVPATSISSAVTGCSTTSGRSGCLPHRALPAELRQALPTARRNRLLQACLGAARRPPHRRSSGADALAACIGALIASERSSGCATTRNGVPLDALVSADLLLSLFLPYSPLHDGAAFIRGDRVAAAGCFLPLSRNTQLGRNMGTRHRAGLGLAEETDAVVLIVSEETGRISLAVDGQMESPLDLESLRRRLGELFSLEEVPMPRRTAWWSRPEWLRK